jgi:hypothetical protein
MPEQKVVGIHPSIIESFAQLPFPRDAAAGFKFWHAVKRQRYPRSAGGGPPVNPAKAGLPFLPDEKMSRCAKLSNIP